MTELSKSNNRLTSVDDLANETQGLFQALDNASNEIRNLEKRLSE